MGGKNKKAAMRIVGEDTELRPCVATIGSFDGVHQGHRFVVEQMASQARKKGLDAVVVTFGGHPLQVLRPDLKPQMLTLAEEKVELLLQTDIDKVALIDFTQELAQMSANDFMRIVLKEQLRVEVLMIGYDNHIGHDHKGFDDCCRYGEALGIEVIGCEEFPSVPKVSSTEVRRALLGGDVETANDLLGYPYFLQGKVVEGFQNGRKLGFPTANLQVDDCKLIPENGVYLVRCKMENGKCNLSTVNCQLSTQFGMLNIGTRPTLHNGRQRSVEVHIFDFDGDLYGADMRLEFLHHLRKEKEFESLEALQQQLAEDEKACRELAGKESFHF